MLTILDVCKKHRLMSSRRANKMESQQQIQFLSLVSIAFVLALILSQTGYVVRDNTDALQPAEHQKPQAYSQEGGEDMPRTPMQRSWCNVPVTIAATPYYSFLGSVYFDQQHGTAVAAYGGNVGIQPGAYSSIAITSLGGGPPSPQTTTLAQTQPGGPPLSRPLVWNDKIIYYDGTGNGRLMYSFKLNDRFTMPVPLSLPRPARYSYDIVNNGIVYMTQDPATQAFDVHYYKITDPQSGNGQDFTILRNVLGSFSQPFLTLNNNLVFNEATVDNGVPVTSVLWIFWFRNGDPQQSVYGSLPYTPGVGVPLPSSPPGQIFSFAANRYDAGSLRIAWSQLTNQGMNAYVFHDRNGVLGDGDERIDFLTSAQNELIFVVGFGPPPREPLVWQQISTVTRTFILYPDANGFYLVQNAREIQHIPSLLASIFNAAVPVFTNIGDSFILFPTSGWPSTQQIAYWNWCP